MFKRALLLRASPPPARAQRYSLLTPFSFKSKRFGLVEAPAGTQTDFASVPRVALWLVDDDSPGILFASVIHDYLYSVRGNLPTQTLTREECDEVLREAMIASGASSALAAVVFRAVRMFGGSHW